MLYINFEPVQLLQLLTSTILPLLVALVTKRDTNAQRRAILLAALSVVSSFLAAMLAALQAHTPFDLIGALIAAVMSFVIAAGLHYGLWTHTGIPATLQAIGSPAPGADLPAETDLAGILGRSAAPRHAAIPGTVLPGVTAAHVAQPAHDVKQDLTPAPDPVE